MRDAHNVAKVRAAESELMAALPDGALMQRAAAGLASVCATLLGPVYGSRIVVLAGSGDNGGDALYAGARLARRGAGVLAIAAGSRIHEGGSAALRASGGRIVSGGEAAAGAAIGRADLILDGMLGIGGHGGLRTAYAGLAALAARSTATVVAVDLPSGVDADTGAVDGPAMQADVTVTFGTWKPGLLVDPGAAHAGVVELVDIGLGPHLDAPDVVSAQAADIAAMLPVPTADSDKYRRGVIGVVSGQRALHRRGRAVGRRRHPRGRGYGPVRLRQAGRGGRAAVVAGDRDHRPPGGAPWRQPVRGDDGGGFPRLGGARAGLGGLAGHGHRR